MTRHWLWAAFMCKCCAKHTPLWLHRNDVSCTETHLLHRNALVAQKRTCCTETPFIACDGAIREPKRLPAPKGRPLIAKGVSPWIDAPCGSSSSERATVSFPRFVSFTHSDTPPNEILFQRVVAMTNVNIPQRYGTHQVTANARQTAPIFPTRPHLDGVRGS